MAKFCVTQSLKVFILMSLCLQNCIFRCKFILKNLYLGFTLLEIAPLGLIMSSRVYLLVSVCIQKCTSLCHYVLKTIHISATLCYCMLQ